MKHKLPCELVRDLFPTYIDELTSDVTNTWIKEHMEDCKECRTVLDTMREPQAQPHAEEEEKEIDFLKKTRKRNVRIAVGSILLAFVIFGVLMFANMFLIGDPVGNESLYCRTQVEENVLTVEATLVDSARVPSDVKFEEEEPGIVNVSYKAVLVSPWNNMGTMTAEYTSKVPITQVKVGERIIWSKGEEILSVTSAVYATRHLYIGDMSANGRTAAALNMGSYLGDFTNELQTDGEPYGWTFLLDEEISAERVNLKETMMRSYAYVLMAVVENLGEVTYEFIVDGEKSKLTVTAEEARTFAGHDIKDCYDDIVLLQNLIRKTGLDASAFMGVYEEQEEDSAVINDGEFQIKIVNNADDDVAMIGLSYALNGDWKGEQCGGYAAEDTKIRRGDSITFVFYPQDFELSGWKNDVVAKFEAQVLDKENSSYPTDSSFEVAVEGGSVYTYILSGNVEEGYVIGQ